VAGKKNRTGIVNQDIHTTVNSVDIIDSLLKSCGITDIERDGVDDSGWERTVGG
jgi:hypothetical protein